MPDALTIFTTFINSPPGVLVAGGVLAGIVWKFFERVEAVLTEDTKLEIAVWLLDRKQVSPKVQSWPDTFAKVFDRVFGEKHFSWKCFWRSSLASFASLAIVLALLLAHFPPRLRTDYLNAFFVAGPFASLSTVLALNAVPDYLSLLETRYLLMLARRSIGGVFHAVLIALDACVTLAIGIVIAVINYPFRVWVGVVFHGPMSAEKLVDLPGFFFQIVKSMATQNFVLGFGLFGVTYIVPAFFTSIWLWLYAGSGFLLRAARRFDIGFQWFNRKFDIEKKPLQSIGLVAGTLVALVYWAAVIAARWI